MKILGLILLGLLFTSTALAEPLTLTWDKVEDIPGAVTQEYRLYTCIDEEFDAPECKVPIATILHPAAEYIIDKPGQGFAIITTVDTDGDESDPSNMVNNIAPKEVINFRIEGTLTILP